MFFSFRVSKKFTNPWKRLLAFVIEKNKTIAIQYKSNDLAKYSICNLKIQRRYRICPNTAKVLGDNLVKHLSPHPLFPAPNPQFQVQFRLKCHVRSPFGASLMTNVAVNLKKVIELLATSILLNSLFQSDQKREKLVAVKWHPCYNTRRKGFKLRALLAFVGVFLGHPV